MFYISITFLRNVLLERLTRQRAWREGTASLPPSTTELRPESVSLSVRAGPTVRRVHLCVYNPLDGVEGQRVSGHSRWHRRRGCEGAGRAGCGAGVDRATMTGGLPRLAVTVAGATGRGGARGEVRSSNSCAPPGWRGTGESAFTTHRG